MHIEVHANLMEIPANQWNGLLLDNNPFMRHEFLLGLEQSQCVCANSGWQASHIAVYENPTCKVLLAAMPCYIKQHSYGEYIFDWAWADAYYRHGMDYYPKLSNAIPFTPATGPRWLQSNSLTTDQISSLLRSTVCQIVEEKNLSSFHSLFLDKNQANYLSDKHFQKRISTQFHWQNKGYNHFDDFLAGLTAKKRKNIRAERRKVLNAGVHYEWLSGEKLSLSLADHLYQLYLRTILRYGAQVYLNKAFFRYLVQHFKHHTLFLIAKYDDQLIAGGLYFKSDNTLYGRYWGSIDDFDSLHFETCYYQAIEWCIKHNYHCFEAGAQGEHKIARGLLPQETYSIHWLRDARFNQAIADYLQAENSQLNHYRKVLAKRSPYKQTL